MLKVFTDEAWDDYLYWQQTDKRTLKKVNTLIKDIERNGMAQGLGMPEPLRNNLRGWWSRRIDPKNRLVYRITGTEQPYLEILQCRTHYGDK